MLTPLVYPAVTDRWIGWHYEVSDSNDVTWYFTFGNWVDRYGRHHAWEDDLNAEWTWNWDPPPNGPRYAPY